MSPNEKKYAACKSLLCMREAARGLPCSMAMSSSGAEQSGSCGFLKRDCLAMVQLSADLAPLLCPYNSPSSCYSSICASAHSSSSLSNAKVCGCPIIRQSWCEHMLHLLFTRHASLDFPWHASKKHGCEAWLCKSFGVAGHAHTSACCLTARECVTLNPSAEA